MTFLIVLGVTFLVAWWLPRSHGGRSAKTAARRAMGLAFVVAGIVHFAMPDSLLAYFPHWVPYPDLINYATGIVEIVGGLAFLAPRFQERAGLVMATYLVLVFPANIYVAVADVAVPGLPDVWWYAWMRLPLQGVFIWWALWSTAPSYTDSPADIPRLIPRRSS